MNNFKRISAIILAVSACIAIFTSCNKNDVATTSTAVDNEATQLAEETNSENIIDGTNAESDKITNSPNYANNNIADNNTPNAETDITNEQTNQLVVENNTVIITDRYGNESVSKVITTKPITNRVTIPNTPMTTAPKITAANTTKPAAKTSNAAKTTKARTVKVVTLPTTTKKPVSNDIVEEKASGIALLSKSDPVQIGNHATIIIQGTPGKTYTIEFYEGIGRLANYDNLEKQKADSNGFVSWSFKIPGSCDPGKRKVVIKESSSKNIIETSITVR